MARRTRCLAAVASLVAALALFPALTAAAVNVGDKPALDFTSYDGKKVNRQTLDGKIVVVDFWATWCGPCVNEAPHMVQLNEKYAPKGLMMVGISLDQSQAELKEGVQQHRLAWAHFFDGKGWGNRYAKEWGVNGIPRTFILSPDGEVLWSGHPAQIDQPLEKAFKDHPPRLVDAKTLAAATASLEASEAALKSGDARAALKAASKFPAAAKVDAATAERAGKLQAELTAAGDKLLADVDPLVEKGEFAEAVTRLKELESMTGVPAAQAAKTKLAALLARPDVKAKFEAQEKARQAAERTKSAAAALAAAKSLQSARKHEEAYAGFKAVAKDYADTPSAAPASAAVAAYEKDPAFVKRVNEAAAGTKAKGALALAQSYRSAGRKDLARKKYESIISDFPGTSFAETAAKEMKEMGR
jgi:thiol-disulfide isomerase/thioredoxin